MALPLGGGAMAATRQNQDLYALPFQIPPRPIQYFLRTARQGVALPAANMEALFVFRVPTQGSFGGQLDTIVNLAWQLLPAAWMPASSLKMYYAFHPDNPKLRRGGNRGAITYSAPDGTEYNDNTGQDDIVYGFTDAQLASRYFAVKAGETDVRAVGDIYNLVREYLVDRAWLQETYDDAADEHRRQGEEESNSGYVRPDYIHFRFYTLRLNPRGRNGIKLSSLMNHHYHDFPTPSQATVSSA